MSGQEGHTTTEISPATTTNVSFIQTVVGLFGAQKWMLYGGLSGGISRTATAPLERLKVLNQVQHMDSKGPRYSGVIPALAKIWREEGFLAYWKGNGFNVVRIIPSDATRFYTYEWIKRLLVKKNQEVTPSIRLISGGLAGMTSTVVTYPLDLVRTRLSAQTGPSSGTGLLATRYRGGIHCLYRIIKEEGVLALYKGLFISMLGIAPYVAINFSVYETLKQAAADRGIQSSVVGGLMLGATSGTAAVTLTYPTDVLRRRMMMDGIGNGQREYKGFIDATIKIMQREGPSGFFRGLIPCYLKVVPATALSWATIETCRKIGGS